MGAGGGEEESIQCWDIEGGRSSRRGTRLQTRMLERRFSSSCGTRNHAQCRLLQARLGLFCSQDPCRAASTCLSPSLLLLEQFLSTYLDLSQGRIQSMGKRAYHRGEVDELCSGCIVGSWLVHGADASPRARFHRPTSCVSMAASHCAKPCIYLDVPGLAVRTAAQREAAHGPGLGSGTGLQQFRLGRTGSCHKAGRLPE